MGQIKDSLRWNQTSSTRQLSSESFSPPDALQSGFDDRLSRIHVLAELGSAWTAEGGHPHATCAARTALIRL
jgi:hypothetical protein